MQKKHLETLIITVILLFGVFLRIKAYFLNSSFFLDEILLAFNVMGRSFKELLQPLFYEQSAPYLFLLISKLIYIKFGGSELVFRFIPFISSIISLFTFYLLSKKILNNFLTRVVAIILFSTNFSLLLYTQIFKQYSSDVLISTIILLIALSVDFKKLSNLKSIALGMLSTISFFLSFPTIFLIGGIFLALIIQTKEYKKLTLFIFPNIIGLFLYLKTTLFAVKSSIYLNTFWANGYDIFNISQHLENFNVLFSFYANPYIAFFLMTTGAILLFKNEKIKAIILISPIVATFLAASLKIYPIAGRLILFLFPIFLLLLLIPIDNVKLNFKFFNIIIYIFTFALLINHSITYLTAYASHKITFIKQDVKPILKILIKEKKDDEILYLYYGANKTYLYYNFLYDLPKNNVHLGQIPPKEQITYEMIEKENLPNNKTIWFLFIRGNDSYEKDIENYKKWFSAHAKIKRDVVLKGVRLIKVCL